MSILLQELLKDIPGDTEEQVDLTRKRINNEVREAIRKETGLALNRKDADQSRKNISVPVVLVPGLPEVLRNMKYDDDQELLLKISPFRRDLEMARNSLKNIKPLLKKLSLDDSCEESLKDKGGHIESNCSLIDALLQLFEGKDDPVERILEVNKDILGAYRYYPVRTRYPQQQNAKIELYWGVIGLVAEMLGVSVDSLTAVVLIHEVAHAYTHLGADIDGKRWDSEGFAKSEHALKEGLAQYYTYLICSQIDNRVIGTSEAFNALLKRQADDYRSHEEKMKDSKVEEIRYSLLDVRRKGVSTLDDFHNTLEEAKQRFSSKHYTI
ncbi:MAG: hypothetical protein V3U54_10000 [Thermodesulfobacteriota bacterium]